MLRNRVLSLKEVSRLWLLRFRRAVRMRRRRNLEQWRKWGTQRAMREASLLGFGENKQDSTKSDMLTVRREDAENPSDG